MAGVKGLANVQQTKEDLAVSNKDSSSSFNVVSFHVSSQSDEFDGDSNMLGIVLYQYDGKTEWELNGVRCKSGYIYLCHAKHLKDVNICKEKSPISTAHAKCYKRLFKVDPDYRKVIAAGFGFKAKKWKYVSGTFSAPDCREQVLTQHYCTKNGETDGKFEDGWHDKKREMHPLEQKWIEKTIKQWIETGQRTLFIQSPTWSWYSGIKWMDYDMETQQYIEEQYKSFDYQDHETYFIRLNCGEFKTNKKLQNRYRIYFSAPHIALHWNSIHSRSNPKWKNDPDKRNLYFLQENSLLKKYRIVRRRDMSMT